MPKTENKPAEFKDSAIDFPLIDRVLAGDSLAYEELFKRYHNRILSLFLQLTNNNFDDSEDFLQDTFIQALIKLHTFRKKSGFFTWLHRMAVNIFLMSRRHNKIYTIPIDEIADDQQMLDKEIMIQGVCNNNGMDIAKNSDIGKLDRTLENIPNRILITQLLSNLYPGYREVIELIYLQGFNGGETAVRMGCSSGNVKSQRHKAIRRLRAMC